jgi:hypothetical protein
MSLHYRKRNMGIQFQIHMPYAHNGYFWMICVDETDISHLILFNSRNKLLGIIVSI